MNGTSQIEIRCSRNKQEEQEAVSRQEACVGLFLFPFAKTFMFDLAAADSQSIVQRVVTDKREKKMSFVTRLLFSAVTSYNHHNPCWCLSQESSRQAVNVSGKVKSVAKEWLSKSTNISKGRAVGETCSGFASPSSIWIRAGCKSLLRTWCRLLCLHSKILKILRRPIKLDVTSELNNSCGRLPSHRIPHSPPRLPLRHHSFELIWKTP